MSNQAIEICASNFSAGEQVNILLNIRNNDPRNCVLDLFRSDALDWTPINDHCKNTMIEVFFGSEPNSRWRNDLFCDNYDNVSTTVVLLSKCNLIHRLDFKRTDFNDFVANVRRGYDCMSPEYRHFTTYRIGLKHVRSPEACQCKLNTVGQTGASHENLLLYKP